MPALYYILKLSLGLIIIWLFYQLVLRRLTFYAWNRWYLVVCPALAFLLPMINISPVLEKNNWTQSPLVSAIPNIPVNAPQKVTAPGLSEQLLSALPYLIAAGALVMLARLLFQYYSLIVLRRSSKLILNGAVKVYQVDQPVMPFSFGNAIFLNQHLHEEHELREIIRHEFIHVKQRHSLDILWSELICILTWYNPFSWLLRKAIRQNLEFIADQQVLKTGLDRRQYQYLLLKVIGTASFSIASNFNFKSLKKRIAMMNKVKSARVHLIRFALLLPVVAILLVAFRNVVQHRQPFDRSVAIADTVPSPKKAFPANVKSIRTVNNQATVTLKNGQVEKYNLNKEDERAAFVEKYGRVAAAPPAPDDPLAPVIVAGAPLPAGRPAPPLPALSSGNEPLAEVVVAGFPSEAVPAIAAPHQDDCYNDKGYCLSVIHTRKGDMVLILQKSKKEPTLIYLEDWNKDKKNYEEKYGKLRTPPPPPPPAPTPPHGGSAATNKVDEVREVHVTNAARNETSETAVVDEVVEVSQNRWRQGFSYQYQRRNGACQ
jgi:beta-lactamase regulating signal transducer with metallopeptidase domain